MILRIIRLFMIPLLLTGAAYAQTATTADGIVGKWTNEDKTRILEFVKNGTTYEAVIVQAPDQQMVGKKQITGLQYANGSYTGSVYLPKKNKTLPCTIKLKNATTLELSAKAGFMSKTQTWTRIAQ